MTAFRSIGIDPGFDGAIVALEEDGSILFAEIAPTAHVGKKREYLEQEMRNILLRLREPVLRGHREFLCALEKAQSMPKQGLSSTFRTGEGSGLWRGLLVGLQIPYERPAPVSWMKAMYAGVSGEGKERSIIAAQRLLPTLNLTPGRLRKPHSGLADAGLLALWARRRHQGK